MEQFYRLPFLYKISDRALARVKVCVELFGIDFSYFGNNRPDEMWCTNSAWPFKRLRVWSDSKKLLARRLVIRNLNF